MFFFVERVLNISYQHDGRKILGSYKGSQIYLCLKFITCAKGSRLESSCFKSLITMTKAKIPYGAFHSYLNTVIHTNILSCEFFLETLTDLYLHYVQCCLFVFLCVMYPSCSIFQNRKWSNCRSHPMYGTKRGSTGLLPWRHDTTMGAQWTCRDHLYVSSICITQWTNQKTVLIGINSKFE
jgi:hypothetical protein